jgi:hypothetical protein
MSVFFQFCRSRVIAVNFALQTSQKKKLQGLRSGETVNWEQMANGSDNYCLLLTNHKQTPINELHCPPCNIILCSGLQVNYFPSFQTLSAIKHAESSAKIACTSNSEAQSRECV